MRVPVLTAVSDAVWEAELVAALERGDLGVTVVRRCVDLADVLATATTGSARAAVLSVDLRRLDRDALSRLTVAGVAVVGLVPPGDEDAERRLRQLGVVHVLPSDSPPDVLSAAVLEAVRAPRPPSPGQAATVADPLAALPVAGRPEPPPGPDPVPGGGRVVAVWGPTSVRPAATAASTPATSSGTSAQSPIPA